MVEAKINSSSACEGEIQTPITENNKNNKPVRWLEFPLDPFHFFLALLRA